MGGWKWVSRLLDGREPSERSGWPGAGVFKLKPRYGGLEPEVAEDMAMRGLSALEICPKDGQRYFLGEVCPMCSAVATNERLKAKASGTPATKDPMKLLRAFCDLAMALPQPPRWDADWYRWRALRGLAHWGRAVLDEKPAEEAALAA